MRFWENKACNNTENKYSWRVLVSCGNITIHVLVLGVSTLPLISHSCCSMRKDWWGGGICHLAIASPRSGSGSMVLDNQAALLLLCANIAILPYCKSGINVVITQAVKCAGGCCHNSYI